MAAQSIQQEDIFEFVTVRPAQKSEEVDTELGATLTKRGPQTDLLGELAEMRQRANPRSAVQHRARQWLDENAPFAMDPNAEVGALRQKLLKLHDDVLGEPRATETSTLGETVEVRLGKPPGEVAQSDAFQKAHRFLWNMVYATSAAGSAAEKPAERQRLLGELRAAELVHALAETGSSLDVGRFRNIAAMVPVLPGEVFPLPKRVYRPSSPSGQKREEERRAFLEKKKKQLIERLISLKNASDEIQRLHEDFVTQNVQRSSRRRLIEMDISETDVPADGEAPAVRSASSKRTRLWNFPAELVASLSEPTRSALETQRIEVGDRPISEVFEKLDNGMQRLTDKLYRQEGREQVVALGKVFRSLEERHLRDVERLASMLVDTPGLYMLDDDPQTLIEIAAGERQTPEWEIGVQMDDDQAPKKSAARALGLGELNRVEQDLLRYEDGEVAHIENVMESERRERKHRRLNRTEETFLTEEVQTVETEKDLQKTERFEMSRETQKTVESERSLDAGVTVTAKYGPVQMKADTGFSSRNARSKSVTESTSYAQEITKRSLKRIQEQIREQRERTTVREIEETNTHGFDNSNGGGEHIVGIYRWVDKVYQARVVNYGERMMFEFTVPEPAAYYRYMQEQKPTEGVTMEKPSDEIEELKPSELDASNYQTWVQRYQVAGVSPPPPKYKFVSTTFKSKPGEESSTQETQTSNQLEIDEGYKANEVQIEGGVIRADPSNPNDEVDVYIGDNRMTLSTAGHEEDKFDVMAGETGTVPVALRAFNVKTYAVTVELRCVRTNRKMEEWKLDTYKTLIDAYKAQKSEYEEQVRAARSRQGVEIEGRNPESNREIEREELKKHAISLLRAQRYENPEAVSDPDKGAPEIDFEDADTLARMIQFFEQAFEWDQMSYIFYPYYWASTSRWDETFPISDDDPLFTKFLRAGAARIVVPVRKGYEDAISVYQVTGDLWEGEDMPVVEDELYVSIVEELKARRGGDTEEGTIGDTWMHRVPTDLVRLQKGQALPSLQDSNEDSES